MSSQDLFAPSSETKRLSVQLDPEDLKKIGMPEDEARDFLKLRDRYLKKPFVDWPQVQPITDGNLVRYDQLKDVPRETVRELLSKLIVVELNGGLGTRMGCKGAKSTIPIFTKSAGHSTLTFLDCKVMQIEEINKEYDVDIPLVLMNSFNTDVETKKMIEKYKGKRVRISTFIQSKYPLLYKDTLAPSSSNNAKEAFYPPGSGEVFTCFKRSGLLDQYLKEGKEYMFISNVENLGATIDYKLLHHFNEQKLDSMLEVTSRISTDEGGGTPVLYRDHVHVLELSQVPYDHVGKFGISTFKYWNTNNMWARIKTVSNLLSMGAMDLDFVVKMRNVKGRGTLQIETPVAMAIHNFKKKALMYVPRSRHKQVKKTSELLIVQSELFDIDEKGMLEMNPKRVPSTEPLIKLGEEFRDLDQYEKRFKSLPNILELDHLTVSGNVTFGSNVTLKGTVIIVAETGSKIDIPDHVILENKIVSGSLVVLDY